jgi:hypothetical protein
MAYVDLNPVRAGVAATPESSRFTSVHERVQNGKDASASQAEPGARQASDAAASASERGGWLSPVPLAKTHAQESRRKPAGRASNRGCLPMSESDYLHLLDWSGRVLRHGKGRIPASAPPILSRLQISEEGWLALVKDFGRLFRRAAGTPESLTAEATRRDRHWLHGTRNSQAVFNGTA